MSLALKFVTQNDRDFMELIYLYPSVSQMYHRCSTFSHVWDPKVYSHHIKHQLTFQGYLFPSIPFFLHPFFQANMYFFSCSYLI